MVPNLNGEGRFLRGGNTDKILEIQEDMFLNHDHEVIDSGHTHTDTGHTHGYIDYSYDVTPGHYKYGTIGTQNDFRHKTTDSSQAKLTKESSNIEIAQSKNLKSGTETRPKNMVVEWIIKIC